jgi:hypothetical protein
LRGALATIGAVPLDDNLRKDGIEMVAPFTVIGAIANGVSGLASIM